MAQRGHFFLCAPVGMLAPALVTVFCSPMVLQAAANERTAGGSPSSIFSGLRFETFPGLELFQHGRRSIDGAAERANPTHLNTMVELLAQQVIGTAAAWQDIKAELKRTARDGESPAESEFEALQQKVPELVKSVQKTLLANADLAVQTRQEAVQRALFQAVTLMGIVYSTLATISGHADDLLAKSLSYRNNTSREVRAHMDEEIDARTKPLQDTVVEGFQPLLDQWNKIREVLEDDGQMLASTLEKLGYGGTFMDVQATYGSILKETTLMSAALSHVAALIDSLVVATAEERKRHLITVVELAAVATGQLAAFERNITSDSGQLLARFTSHPEIEPAITIIWRSLLKNGAYMAEKTTDSLRQFLEAARAAAEELLLGDRRTDADTEGRD